MQHLLGIFCKEELALTQNLMSAIADLKNLETVLRKAMSNKGSGGIDGMNVEALKMWFSSRCQELWHQLLSGTYQVSAVKEIVIPKPNGEERQLGNPTVKDCLVQQAISQILSKRYESIFSDFSYGFRPNRNAHQALPNAGEYVAEAIVTK